MEEMGFDCEVEKVLDFIYKAELDSGLTEYEFDHVFIGKYNQDPVVNPEEVDSFKWIEMDKLEADIANNPDIYTEWFKIIFDRFYTHVKAL